MLTDTKQYYSLSLLLKRDGQHERVVNLWRQVLSGELVDTRFPGMTEFVDYVYECVDDRSLFLSVAKFVLSRDSALVTHLFPTVQSIESLGLTHKDILELCAELGESTKLRYLEHMIDNLNVVDTNYTNQLWRIYLDYLLSKDGGNFLLAHSLSNQFAVLQSPPSFVQFLKAKLDDNPDDEYTSTRHKLLIFLLSEKQLDDVKILSELAEVPYHAEKAMLYGRLGQHDKAFQILIHDLRDVVGAEQHCQKHRNSGALLLELLQVLLKLSSSRDIVKYAVPLLNRHARELDATKVLPLLPKNWSIGLVTKFLEQVILSGNSLRMDTQIVRNVCKAQNLQTLAKRTQIFTNEYIFLTEELPRCPICNLQLAVGAFCVEYSVNVRLRRGPLLHVNCAEKKLRETEEWRRKRQLQNVLK